MKIVCCVKWAGALGDDIEFDDEGNVDRDYLDHALNEWDSFALAEALRLRDESDEGEVVALTAGDEEAQEALVESIAMGADRAVRLDTGESQVHDPIALARLLAPVIEREHPDLVFCGAQSADASHGAAGAALAGLLDLPCVAVVTAIEVEPAAGKVVVQRELEGGVIDVVELQTPAVLTIQTGISEPRYLTLRAIQQARQSEIGVLEADVEAAEPGYRIRSMFVPERAAADLIDGGPDMVAETITKLIQEVRG